VAAEASCIYLAFVRLPAVDQYSFTRFLFKAMERAVPNNSVSERIAKLEQKLHIAIFVFVSRGRFEKHALIVSGQLCLASAQKSMDSWNSIQALALLDGFPNLTDVASSPNRWQDQFIGSRPQSMAVLPLD
jgi:hypothetical protein